MSSGDMWPIEMELEAEIDRLPIDLLAHIFAMIPSFTDLAQACGVCRKWKEGVKLSLGRRESLSFAGWKMDDYSTARLIHHAYSLRQLDISRSRWGCQITDHGLHEISLAKCIPNLKSISLWGMAGITDKGVVQLISRANSLQNLNIGGTFVTDVSLFAIADNCPNLKTIGLWSCRHVTETGLLILVSKCCKLESINVWGMRVPVDCFIGLVAISPSLQIKSRSLLLNSMWPVL
ncbi:F-box protein At5g67140 [Cucurbita maxima]|uniref:F-box protein At5g67140 n=1 Tax=Cucurbita maxima TaxID=3661 RepID=A0A6J1KZ61_CUCMA|nr:F-box protein At5g67140 [Cucurbita maxima]